eukprot:2697919-Amphidinium_carterae.1
MQGLRDSEVGSLAHLVLASVNDSKSSINNASATHEGVPFPAVRLSRSTLRAADHTATIATVVVLRTTMWSLCSNDWQQGPTFDDGKLQKCKQLWNGSCGESLNLVSFLSELNESPLVAAHISTVTCCELKSQRTTLLRPFSAASRSSSTTFWRASSHRSERTFRSAPKSMDDR